MERVRSISATVAALIAVCCFIFLAREIIWNVSAVSVRPLPRPDWRMLFDSSCAGNYMERVRRSGATIAAVICVCCFIFARGKLYGTRAR